MDLSAPVHIFLHADIAMSAGSGTVLKPQEKGLYQRQVDWDTVTVASGSESLNIQSLIGAKVLLPQQNGPKILDPSTVLRTTALAIKHIKVVTGSIRTALAAKNHLDRKSTRLNSSHSSVSRMPSSA